MKGVSRLSLPVFLAATLTGTTHAAQLIPTSAGFPVIIPFDLPYPVNPILPTPGRPRIELPGPALPFPGMPALAKSAILPATALPARAALATPAAGRKGEDKAVAAALRLNTLFDGTAQPKKTEPKPLKIEIVPEQIFTLPEWDLEEELGLR